MEEDSEMQEQINKYSGVTKSPEQISNSQVYKLEEAVQALDEKGVRVTLPAGACVKKM